MLNGVGIIEDHARLVYIDTKLNIICAAEKAAMNTFINGESIEKYYKDKQGYVRTLNDLDRIIFGTSSTFLIRLPNKEGNVPTGCVIDWE